MGECDPFHKTIFHFVLVCPYCPLDIVGRVCNDYLMNKKGKVVNMATLINTKMDVTGFVRYCSECETVSLNEDNRYCGKGHKMDEYLMRKGIIKV